ncbi:MAG: hypothetical protein SNJ64_00265 [Endomicrobiia bacterium]
MTIKGIGMTMKRCRNDSKQRTGVTKYREVQEYGFFKMYSIFIKIRKRKN